MAGKADDWGAVPVDDDDDDDWGAVPVNEAAAPSNPGPSLAPLQQGPAERLATTLGADFAGPVVRGAKSLDRSLFPTGSVADPVTGIVKALASPLQTAKAIHSAGVERTTRGLGKAINVLEGDRPWSVDRSKDTGAVEDVIAGLLAPVGGTIAQDVLSQGASGDIAGAAGSIAGQAGNALVAGGIQGAAFPRGAAAPAVKDLTTPPPSATGYRGPMTPGEATGSALTTSLERIPESSPFTGRWWKPFRSSQQAALKDMGDRVVAATRGGAAKAGNLVESMGAAIGQAKDEAKAAVSKMYAGIDEATKGTPREVKRTVMKPSSIVGSDGLPLEVPTQVAETVMDGAVRPSTKGMKEFAARQAEELRARPSAKEHARVLSILDEVAALPDDVTFEAMHGARSDWRSVARGKDAIPSQSIGVVKKLEEMADGSMRKAAVASGKGDVVAALDAASLAHKQNVYTFNTSVVAKIAKAAVQKKDPSAIAALIRQKGTSLTDIDTLVKTVPEPLLAQTRAVIFEDMLQKSARPSTAVPGGAEAVAGAPLSAAGSGKVLNGTILDKMLERLQEDGKAARLFKPEHISNLSEVARVARTVTPRASAMLQNFMFLGTGAIFSSPAGAAGVAAGAGGLGAASWVLTGAGRGAAAGFLRTSDKLLRAGRTAAEIAVNPQMKMWTARMLQLQEEEKQKSAAGGGAGGGEPPDAVATQ